MFKLFYFAFFAIFSTVELSPETRVYNAKALSPNGKYDLNIQVIQVRIVTPENDLDSPTPSTSTIPIEDERVSIARGSKHRPIKIQLSDEPRAQLTQYSPNTIPENKAHSDATESFVFLLLACSLGIVLVLTMTYMILTVRSYRKKPKLARSLSFSVIYHHRPMEHQEFYYHHSKSPPYKKPYLPPVTGPPPELPPRLNRPSTSRNHAQPLLPKLSLLEDEDHRRMLSLNKKNYLNNPQPRARTHSF